MIIVKLQGGLGNQMFQYAVAKCVAGKSNIYLDTDFLNSNINASDFTKRELELPVFKNIKIRIASNINKNLIKKKYPLKRILYPSKYIYQSEKNEFIDLSQIRSYNLYLDGYFQNENYFKDLRNKVLYDFTFPELSDNNKIIAKNISETKNAISIHIRRGDYLKPSNFAFHGLLPTSYYKKAIQEIETKIVNPHYYIFSDDVNWCKSNLMFLKTNFTIVSDQKAKSWEDMHLMSLCRHNIIANSSYSWWSAWLNTNLHKIVIAPSNWFVNNKTEILPSQWIKI